MFLFGKRSHEVPRYFSWRSLIVTLMLFLGQLLLPFQSCVTAPFCKWRMWENFSGEKLLLQLPVKAWMAVRSTVQLSANFRAAGNHFPGESTPRKPWKIELASSPKKFRLAEPDGRPLVALPAARKGTLDCEILAKQREASMSQNHLQFVSFENRLACSWDIYIDRSCCLCHVMRIQTGGHGDYNLISTTNGENCAFLISFMNSLMFSPYWNAEAHGTRMLVCCREGNFWPTDWKSLSL